MGFLLSKLLPQLIYPLGLGLLGLAAIDHGMASNRRASDAGGE